MPRSWIACFLLCGFVALVPARLALGMCNVIPGADQIQRGSLGSLNRPYASPRDVVGVIVEPGVCDESSAGMPGPAALDDVVVTVVYEPTNGAPGSVVAMANGLAGDCAALPEIASCVATYGSARVHCADPAAVGGTPFVVREDGEGLRELFFGMPDTYTDGTAFLPDPDSGLDATADLTGPARIVVTRRGTTVPCGAPAPMPPESFCDALTGSIDQEDGIVACVDALYTMDGTCDTDFSDRQLLFPGFTALPEPNRFADVCEAPTDVCRNTSSELRATTDAEGNFLMPWDYSGILEEVNGVPVARVGTGDFLIDPFPDPAADPLLFVPRNGFLSSHAPEGLTLPPIFTPISDPSDPASPALFGTIDALRGVMRIARRSPRFGECVDTGVRTGVPCVQTPVSGSDQFFDECPTGSCQPAVCYDGDTPDPGPDPMNPETCASHADCCPGGVCPATRRCGPVLFDLADRLDNGGTGAFTLVENQAVDGFQDIELRESVPIEGLNASQDVFAFVLNEQITGTSANADADTDDFVVTIASRSTGNRQEMGSVSGVPGRAVARVVRPPFPRSAVATEGPYLAFLESEAKEGGISVNADGDAFDYIVRVFALNSQDGEDAEDLLAGIPPLSASPFSRVNERPLVISGGKLFFWSNELHDLSITDDQRLTDAVTTGETIASGLAMSGNGRWVAYVSDGSDVWVVDRLAPNDPPLQMDVNPTTGLPLTGEVAWVAISHDGRHVVFSIGSEGLVDIFAAEGMAPGLGSQIVLVDRDDFDPANRTLELISRRSDGTAAQPLICPVGTVPPGQEVTGAIFPKVSSDGRFVVYQSAQTDLVPGDTNGGCGPGTETSDPRRGQDVFLFDRQDSSVERVSVHADGSQLPEGVGLIPNGDRGNRVVDDLGRYVAFLSEADISPSDANGVIDAYVREMDGGVFDTLWLSCSRPANGSNECCRHPGASEGAACDPDFASQTEAVRLGDVGDDAAFIVFDTSRALVPFDTNGVSDVYAWKNGVEQLFLATRTVDDTLANGASRFGSLTKNSRAIRFESVANNLVPDDEEDTLDIFFQDLLDAFGGAIPNGDVIRISRHPRDPSPEQPSRAAAANGVDGVLLAPDMAGDPDDVFASGDLAALADPTTPDVDGDGNSGDWLLRIIDLDQPVTGPGDVVSLPAMPPISVSRGDAAYLRSEAEIGGLNGVCNQTSGPGDVDLNADSDCRDPIAFLWTDGEPAGETAGVTNLGEVASEVVLTPTLVAGSVGTPAGRRIGVYDRAAETWDISPTSNGVAIQARGDLVAYLRLESEEGVDLNGDGETDDRVVGLYQRGFGEIHPSQYIFAEEFVMGDSVVAFRTQESRAPAGQCDFNGDGDCADFVLHAYDVTLGDADLMTAPSVELVNSGFTAEPCRLEACDPFQPYRVEVNSVRFLTDEAEEGESLNSDGDQEDLVVQLFNVRRDKVSVVATVAESPGEDDDTDIDPVDAAPIEAPVGTASSEDTPSTASASRGSSQIVLTSGLCVATTGTDCSAGGDLCEPGEFCDVDPASDPMNPTSMCFRPGEACQSDADCLPVETCAESRFVVVAAPDSDADGFVDSLDNCPNISNPSQIDEDGDGLGEPIGNELGCDDAVCGNGVLEGDEECDLGETGGEGCTTSCKVGGCFGDVDLDGTIDSNDRDLFFSLDRCYTCSGDCLEVCDSNDDDIVNNSDALAFKNVEGTECAAPMQPIVGCGLLGIELLLVFPVARLGRRLRRRGARVG